MFRLLSLFTFLFFVPSASAVIVLKAKENKALVLLEGVRTKKGAYYEVFDLYGNKKGLAKIDRVAKTKAIVTLKSGSIAKNWLLEPVTKELALYELKKSKKRKAIMARIHRDQIKRKVAFKKKQLEREKRRKLALKKQLEREKRRKLARKRALDKKRRLVEKKRAIKRKIASYGLEENILEDLGEETDTQAPEILSYEAPAVLDNATVQEENHIESIDRELEQIQKDKSGFFTLGIQPRAEYNFMKVNPINDSKYLMSGFGFGAILSANFSLNRFVDMGANLGAKRFSVSVGEEECGQAQGCSLLIYYALASVNLKLHLVKINKHKLWIMGEGAILQPLAYSNKVPNLTKESFSPFHGTIGGGVGVEFNFRKFTLPVFVDFHVYMPPTQTTLTGSAGLQFGFSYKF